MSVLLLGADGPPCRAEVAKRQRRLPLFMLVGIFSLVGAFATWNSGRKDPEYTPNPKGVAAWGGVGVVCLGLMTLLWLL
ncbi:hypothetical protein [Streptomyces sp. CRN 30]|uniref:hypothetical protein n=1 Tax=Streptomyces sp. CRN 30 TaxID=3075613 RepID=UPI002A82A77C|nr:hypothetical protein [Streptomyces sp. CRN 30]